jgi:hypothetical protein
MDYNILPAAWFRLLQSTNRNNTFPMQKQEAGEEKLKFFWQLKPMYLTGHSTTKGTA